MHEEGIIVGQKKVSEKSNEITAIVFHVELGFVI
jgi:hypothetical protein